MRTKTSCSVCVGVKARKSCSPTIAAAAYKRSVGQPFIYPRNDLDYTANFLQMCFAVPCEPYVVNPTIAKALAVFASGDTIYVDAGTYATTASGTDGNYNLSFVDGSMLINKAALTATGNSTSVTYNGANQTVSGFTVSGLQGSDTVASLSSVVASGATGKNAGSYTNTVTVAP